MVILIHLKTVHEIVYRPLFQAGWPAMLIHRGPYVESLCLADLPKKYVNIA